MMTGEEWDVGNPSEECVKIWKMSYDIEPYIWFMDGVDREGLHRRATNYAKWRWKDMWKSFEFVPLPPF